MSSVEKKNLTWFKEEGGPISTDFVFRHCKTIICTKFSPKKMLISKIIFFTQLPAKNVTKIVQVKEELSLQMKH